MLNLILNFNYLKYYKISIAAVIALSSERLTPQVGLATALIQRDTNDDAFVVSIATLCIPKCQI